MCSETSISQSTYRRKSSQWDPSTRLLRSAWRQPRPMQVLCCRMEQFWARDLRLSLELPSRSSRPAKVFTSTLLLSKSELEIRFEGMFSLRMSSSTKKCWWRTICSEHRRKSDGFLQRTSMSWLVRQLASPFRSYREILRGPTARLEAQQIDQHFRAIEAKASASGPSLSRIQSSIQVSCAQLRTTSRLYIKGMWRRRKSARSWPHMIFQNRCSNKSSP